MKERHIEKYTLTPFTHLRIGLLIYLSETDIAHEVYIKQTIKTIVNNNKRKKIL